jgi:lipoate-protein ligase A
MKDNHVHLARRTTGGGSVFHDLGNTNFTFLSPKALYKRENNIRIILNALKKIGIEGEASGRNDLLVPFSDGPRKFSGSAYREKQDRAFHHGTLLLHADLSQLGEYLTPNPKKLQAKGKESVRARVVNLNEIKNDIDHRLIVDVMVSSFEEFYSAKADKEDLTIETLEKIPELKAQYNELSSWDWIYGRTLQFTHQMSEYLKLGFFDFHFQVDEGVIKDIQVYSDCLYPHLVDEISKALKDRHYRSSDVQEAFQNILKQEPEIRPEILELQSWLASQIEI